LAKRQDLAGRITFRILSAAHRDVTKAALMPSALMERALQAALSLTIAANN
jgi:hypothetical protein